MTDGEGTLSRFVNQVDVSGVSSQIAFVTSVIYTNGTTSPSCALQRLCMPREDTRRRGIARARRIWDARSGKSRRKLVGKHTGRINGAIFSPDAESRWVLTAGSDGAAVLWDSASGDPVRRFDAEDQEEILCTSFSADSKRILNLSAARASVAT